MADKILFIDDDVDTLKLVGLMLERQGYEIAVASDGITGLSKAATELPDLILLDVMMPDLDGLEVTRRLRADPALAHIPIIMFTAKTMVDDKVAGFSFIIIWSFLITIVFGNIRFDWVFNATGNFLISGLAFLNVVFLYGHAVNPGFFASV